MRHQYVLNSYFLPHVSQNSFVSRPTIMKTFCPTFFHITFKYPKSASEEFLTKAS